MNKVIATAVTTVAATLAAVLFAPSAWAMVAPVDPDGGRTTSTSTSVSGIPVWQVVAIAAVGVVIGAVGTYLAQRTHRHADTSSVSMA
jgi:hypothetical protein